MQRNGERQAWYLIYTKPQQEQRARENLERQGYVVYLPLMRVRRRRMGRPVERVEPMFPRYLFVRLNATSDNWAPIRSTFGVTQLVRFGRDPARIPDDLVEVLQAASDSEGVCNAAPPPADFRSGDTVRIRSGAFAGYAGIFQARTGQERVILLLEVAGQVARVKIREEDLDTPS